MTNSAMTSTLVLFELKTSMAVLPHRSVKGRGDQAQRIRERGVQRVGRIEVDDRVGIGRRGAGRSPAKTRKPAAFESAIQQTSSYASGEPSMSCACARTILATEFETMLFLSTPFEYAVSVFLNML